MNTDPLAHATPGIARVLDRALAGHEVGLDDALVLSTAAGPDLEALCAAADALRRRQVGDDVTYIVNRNINFTNVCVMACRFCAFSRDLRSDQGYDLDDDEVVRRALQAQSVGATEVCVQAGLTPDRRGRRYPELIRAIKAAAPDLHIHACSPEEVRYNARLMRVGVAEYLAVLRDAGLDSLPGTSAEILDDALRDRISPGRLTTGDWLEVIESAHGLGLRTTSTMMYGHVETWKHRIEHLLLLRSVQRETGGFTEFVPLVFIRDEAPLFRAQVGEMPPRPDRDERRRMYAISRIVLGADIPHLQASWVKDGIEAATDLLGCGVDDLGGTLINESISTSAGAGHGQRMTPGRLRAAIRSVGRVPVQRNSLYGPLRRFDDPADDPLDPLDTIDDPEAVFGSYDALVQQDRYRYKRALVRIGDRSRTPD